MIGTCAHHTELIDARDRGSLVMLGEFNKLNLKPQNIAEQKVAFTNDMEWAAWSNKYKSILNAFANDCLHV